MRRSVSHHNRPSKADAKLALILHAAVAREEDNLKVIAEQIADLQRVHKKTTEKVQVLRRCATAFDQG